MNACFPETDKRLTMTASLKEWNKKEGQIVLFYLQGNHGRPQGGKWPVLALELVGLQDHGSLLPREHNSTRVGGSDTQKKAQNNNTDILDFCGTVQTCDVPRIKIKCCLTNLGNFQASFFNLEIFSVANRVLYFKAISF